MPTGLTLSTGGWKSSKGPAAHQEDLQVSLRTAQISLQGWRQRSEERRNVFHPAWTRTSDRGLHGV